MARTLDETLAAVQAEGTQDDSVIAFIEGLKAQIGLLSPADQAKVDAVFDQAIANAGKLAGAIGTTPTGDPAPVA